MAIAFQTLDKLMCVPRLVLSIVVWTGCFFRTTLQCIHAITIYILPSFKTPFLSDFKIVRKNTNIYHTVLNLLLIIILIKIIS